MRIEIDNPVVGALCVLAVAVDLLVAGVFLVKLHTDRRDRQLREVKERLAQLEPARTPAHAEQVTPLDRPRRTNR